MKIFVINLKSDFKKRETMTDILNKYTSDYTFFEAINGKELKDDEYKINLNWMNPYDNTHTTYGEVGCALSHYSLWKKMIDENIEQALILEDDVVIKNPDFISIIDNIPTDAYDLIYLGRKKMSGIKEEQVQLESAKNLLVKPTFSYWTCAYILTLSGAKKLCTTDYLNNLIAADEYMPYLACVGNHINNEAQDRLDKYYGHIKQNIEGFNTYAFEPTLIQPNNQAFSQSSTFHSPTCNQFRQDVLCITVATDNNDCVKRYRQSCLRYGFNPVILGLDTKWNGGDMSAGQGGGQKINFLKAYLNDLSSNKLLIFTDSYDVICNNHLNFMIETYKINFEGKIVFGAENSCWPDKNLANDYPLVDGENKYLNSGNFIGWSDDIKKILELPIENSADDQLYYTHRFFESLNQDIDTPITLDYDNQMFFCLNGATNTYNLNKSKSCLTVKNKRPTFIHGNGPSSIKRELNYIGSYICGGYNSTYGYKNMSKLETLPKILIIFEEFDDPPDVVFEKIINLDYPRELIQFIYIYEDAANILLLNAFSKISLVKKTDISLVDTVDTISNNVDYVFYLTSRAILENKDTLKRLVEEKKDVIGPLLVKPGYLFSNFWGDISRNNFYKRSKNYFDIINNNERGCWNISYIWEALLIKVDLFTKKMLMENIEKGEGLDMAFCYNMRKTNRFMYVLNTEKFGYYSENKPLNLNSFETDKVEWEKKYIDNGFRENVNIIENVGINIHKVKIFTKLFCEELIQKAEKVNKWSQGGNKHYDKRIGNIENHPTQDIHMNALGLEKMWQFIVDTYIKPLIWKEYKYDTKDINISFIVKYSMDGQKELKSHHDSSTYTINICLNNDFEGGGCRFIRQNKTVINKDIGSVTIHPGRLTHYHQGLPISSGVRYIMVSFIN